MGIRVTDTSTHNPKVMARARQARPMLWSHLLFVGPETKTSPLSRFHPMENRATTRLTDGTRGSEKGMRRARKPLAQGGTHSCPCLPHMAQDTRPLGDRPSGSGSSEANANTIPLPLRVSFRLPHSPFLNVECFTNSCHPCAGATLIFSVSPQC